MAAVESSPLWPFRVLVVGIVVMAEISRPVTAHSAEVCRGLYYDATGVPWQTKSIRIIKFFLLKIAVNPHFAAFVACF